MNNLTIITAMAFSGAAALIYEVVSSKALFYYFAATTYSVATVLIAFLFGIALGSFIISKLLSKIKNKRTFFATLQLLVALYALFILSQYELLPKFLSFSYNFLPNNLILSKFLVSLLFLLIPTLFLGACFPLASSLIIKSNEQTDKKVGILYSFDTFGAILGAAVAGFVFLPIFGLKITIFIAAFLNFLSGLIILEKNIKKLGAYLTLSVTLVLLFIFLFNYSDFIKTEFVKPLEFPNALQASSAQVKGDHAGTIRKDYEQVIFQKNSPYGLVEVLETKDPGKYLQIDKKGQCSIPGHGSEDEIAHLVARNFDYPVEILNIGLGCGFTLSSILEYKQVIEVDVVEINTVIEEVARDYFSEENNYALEDPRVNLIIGDGYLFLQEEDEKYDGIIIDVQNPVVAHSSPLYTYEYFVMANEHLKQGGVFGLWGFGGNYGYNKTLYKTLDKAFPEVYFIDYGVSLFLASDHEISEEILSLTPENKEIMEKIKNDQDFEINTLDHQVLEKYFAKQ